MYNPGDILEITYPKKDGTNDVRRVQVNYCTRSEHGRRGPHWVLGYRPAPNTPYFGFGVAFIWDEKRQWDPIITFVEHVELTPPAQLPNLYHNRAYDPLM